MEIFWGIGGLFGFVAALLAIYAFVWPLIKRHLLRRHEPPPATKEDIAELKRAVQMPEFLDGLPTAQKQTLRAAYQEARRLQLEGYELQNRHKHEQAIAAFGRALPLAQDDSQRAALHVLRGNSQESISDYSEAEQSYQAALALVDNIHDKNDRLSAKAVALGNVGLVYAHRGEPRKAEEHFKKALAICEDTDHRRGQAAVIGNLGVLYRHSGKLNKAQKHFKKAFAIQQDVGDRLGQANQLGNLGNVYVDRGDLSKAEEHYNKVLQIHEDVPNPLSQANALGALGNVCARRGDLAKAEEHLKQALDIYGEIGNKLGQAAQLGNLGNVYAQRGELHKAEEHQKRALAIDEDIGNKLGQAEDLQNLGAVAVQRGELPKGRELLEEARRIFAEVGSSADVQKTDELIARLEATSPPKP